jgi:hypothetical protein
MVRLVEVVEWGGEGFGSRERKREDHKSSRGVGARRKTRANG